MTVYIDVLILTNVYFTYFFIKSVMLVSHKRFSPLRTLLASLLGGISSLQIFISDSLPLSTLAKLLSLALISLLLSGFNARDFLDTALKLILVNLLFIGLCIVLWRLLGRSVYIIGMTVYFDISLVILVLVTVITYAAFWVYDYISFRLSARRGAKVRVETENSLVTLDGISDTGNSLYDFLSQRSVIVCSSKELEAAFENKLYKLLPFETVNGSGLVRVYVPKKVYIDSKSVEANIALVKLDKPKAIFNPNILR